MISLLVTLVVFGVMLYLLELIPMDGTVKQIIRVVAILFAALYVLGALGVWNGFNGITLK